MKKRKVEKRWMMSLKRRSCLRSSRCISGYAHGYHVSRLHTDLGGEFQGRSLEQSGRSRDIQLTTTAGVKKRDDQRKKKRKERPRLQSSMAAPFNGLFCWPFCQKLKPRVRETKDPSSYVHSCARRPEGCCHSKGCHSEGCCCCLILASDACHSKAAGLRRQAHLASTVRSHRLKEAPSRSTIKAAR